MIINVGAREDGFGESSSEGSLPKETFFQRTTRRWLNIGPR
jgi:hypothetical protein